MPGRADLIASAKTVYDALERAAPCEAVRKAVYAHRALVFDLLVDIESDTELTSLVIALLSIVETARAKSEKEGSRPKAPPEKTP